MLLQLDFSTTTPIYQQIRDQIVQGIAKGELKPGERLPTVRTLASECGINIMTASKAYQLLKQEGHTRGDRRGGTFVCKPEGDLSPDSSIIEALRLHLAELIVGGMSNEDVLTLCKHLLDDVSSQKNGSLL
ncbi:GntR family transcriptional regulator [Atopobium fossor]|uniref:GntR family transcriptional regulator n=1 Tax=Atopobium fossor TaxID=39487 RepID=UPI000418E9C8|nr:GntR family transcriptional regulator [Atopobium fossor]